MLARDDARRLRELEWQFAGADRRHHSDRRLLVQEPDYAMSQRPRPSHPLRFSRRNLLRGSLGMTALLPLLDAQRADGQNAAPTRLVVFTTPNGTRNSLFWPTGTETNFTLNTFTPDLAPFKSKLTFLKGIKLNPALQNGALGGTVGSEHARGTGGMLTGRPLKSGTQFKSFGNTTSGWGSGQSLDQYLVCRLKPT